MAGRKTVTTTHGRLIGDEEAVETPQRGDTILITDYERIMPRGEGHIAVVRLAELRGTTPVDECLYETSVVIGDRPFLRMVAESAIYYARDRGIRRVMVANGDVWEVIEAGGIDTTGVEMVRDISPPAAAGDNILITDFDRRYTMGDEFVAVASARHGYMPTTADTRDGGRREPRALRRRHVRRHARDRNTAGGQQPAEGDVEAGVTTLQTRRWSTEVP